MEIELIRIENVFTNLYTFIFGLVRFSRGKHYFRTLLEVNPELMLNYAEKGTIGR